MFSNSCSFTFLFPFSIFSIQLAEILQAFFSPHIPFSTVLRWCFFYHNLVFPCFSVKLFEINLEDFILPVKFVMIIKSSFPLCSYLYFLLYFLLDTWNMNDIFDFILSYNFLAFLVFGFLFLSISLSIDISPLIVSIFFSILIFYFGFLFLSGFRFLFGLTSSLDSTVSAQAHNILLTLFISSSISSQNF